MTQQRALTDPYRIFLFINFLVSLCLGMIFTINLIYHAETAQLTPLQLVLVGTALEVSILIFEVPTGIVADVYSRRLSVIVGYAIMGTGFIVEGSQPVFVNILLGQVIWGLGYTFTSGALQAWMVDEVNDEQRMAGAFMRSSQLGSIAGIIGILTGVCLAVLQINLPILLGGAGLITLALALALIMPERNFKPTPKAERENWRHMTRQFSDGLRMVRGRRLLVVIAGIVFITGLYSEGLDRLWTKHFLDNIGLPFSQSIPTPVWWGIFGIGGMILHALFTEVTRRRVRSTDPASTVRVLWAFNLVQFSGMLIFALAGNFVLALVAYWTAQLFRGLQGPIFDAWSNAQIDSEVRATVLSMISQTDAIGQIAGGPGVGAIGNTFGVRYALMASSLLLLPILGLYGIAHQLIRRAEPAAV